MTLLFPIILNIFLSQLWYKYKHWDRPADLLNPLTYWRCREIQIILLLPTVIYSLHLSDHYTEITEQLISLIYPCMVLTAWIIVSFIKDFFKQ